MYGKLGFVVSGDEFLEDEIPHVPMTWMAGNG
jgi:ElaA protein